MVVSSPPPTPARAFFFPSSRIRSLLSAKSDSSAREASERTMDATTTIIDLTDARRYIIVPRSNELRCPKDPIIRHDLDPWGVQEHVEKDAFLVIDILYLRELGHPPAVRIGERVFNLKRSKL